MSVKQTEGKITALYERLSRDDDQHQMGNADAAEFPFELIDPFHETFGSFLHRPRRGRILLFVESAAGGKTGGDIKILYQNLFQYSTISYVQTVTFAEYCGKPGPILRPFQRFPQGFQQKLWKTRYTRCKTRLKC